MLHPFQNHRISGKIFSFRTNCVNERAHKWKLRVWWLGMKWLIIPGDSHAVQTGDSSLSLSKHSTQIPEQLSKGNLKNTYFQFLKSWKSHFSEMKSIPLVWTILVMWTAVGVFTGILSSIWHMRVDKNTRNVVGSVCKYAMPAWCQFLHYYLARSAISMQHLFLQILNVSYLTTYYRNTLKQNYIAN